MVGVVIYKNAKLLNKTLRVINRIMYFNLEFLILKILLTWRFEKLEEHLF